MKTDDIIDAISIGGQRPITHIRQLEEAFREDAEVVTFTSRFDQMTPDGHLFFLRKGAVSYCRSSDDLVIITIYGEGVIGLMEYLTPSGMFYVRSDSPAETELWRIDNARVTERLAEHPFLWENISRILSSMCSQSLVRDLHMTTRSAWDMLRGKLSELMQLPAHEREAVTVADYVCSRTLLSRTTVLQMLRELRRGDYIQTRNGRLTGIRKLPDNY